MSELDSTIHQPVRLRIMAALTAFQRDEKISFVELKNLISATDGNLGAHLLKLEEARYIKTDKKFVARKPRTYVYATNRGRAAFEEHVEALRQILGEAGK